MNARSPSQLEWSGEESPGFESMEPVVQVDVPAAIPSQRRGRVVEWIALLLLPVGLLYAYGIQRFFQLSGADPFIYTGYTFSTRDLIERWGYPYYAVRFGLILPSKVFAELFGAVNGYLLMRWMVSFVAAAALFHLLRRSYKWQIGAVGAVMLLLNPIYIRAVMTVYSTAIGVPFVAAACALMLMPGSRRTVVICRICAGILLGFTINSNLFSLLPITLMVGVWAFVRATAGRRKAAAELCLIAAAALTVTLAGSLLYWWKFGDADILSPSLNAARSLSSRVSPDKESSLRWLNFRPEIWLAPISSLTLLGAIRCLRRRPLWHERAACLMPISMWLAFILHQLAGGNTLETYFYSSYMLGPTMLAFVIALALLNERWAQGDRVRILIALVVVLGVPVGWRRLAPHLAFWSLNGVLPMLAIGGALIALSLRWRTVSTVVVIWICLVPVLLTIGSPRDVPLSSGQLRRQDPKYNEVYNNYHDSTLDLYALAADFTSSVPRFDTSPGTVVFWSPNDDYLTTLMRWTHLGPYSALQTSLSPSMPFLDLDETAMLTHRTPRYVIILSSLEGPIAGAESALSDLQLNSVRTFRQIFRSGIYTLYVSVIEFVPSTCDQEEEGEPVAWSTLTPCADS